MAARLGVLQHAHRFNHRPDAPLGGAARASRAHGGTRGVAGLGVPSARGDRLTAPRARWRAHRTPSARGDRLTAPRARWRAHGTPSARGGGLTARAGFLAHMVTKRPSAAIISSMWLLSRREVLGAGI